MTGTNQKAWSQTKTTCCEIRHSMYFTTEFSATKSNLGGSRAWKLQNLVAPSSSFFDVSQSRLSMLFKTPQDHSINLCYPDLVKT